MKNKNILHKILDKLFFITDTYIPCVEDEFQREIELLCKDGNKYIAINNQTGKCVTKDLI